MEIQARYEAWLSDPLIDAVTKEELRQLDGQTAELADRFIGWLEFGTGGMRGKIGAGTNRINVYTVRLATQALAIILQEKGLAERGVAIAYDSRRMSREFAHAAAEVFVGNGIPVYVFGTIAPTPILSFAVRYHGTGAGLVITASHNPPEYNGYKAYNAQGVQMLPHEAVEISEKMSTLSLADVKIAEQAQASPLWHDLGEETTQAYFEALLKLVPPIEPGDISVLYTPLHGTGGQYVPEILRRAGFRHVLTVDEQMQPNGSFPTVALPNPEEKGAFALAMQKAQEQPCDLILATDPDADRVGIAVRHEGDWHLLNGNQVGVLLAEFILSRMTDESRRGGVVVKTIVTTEMIQPIAEKYGVEVVNTLTGFKYIGHLIDELPKEGKHFIFGFEESYGYLAGEIVRDKDAVLASLLVAQMAAFYKNQGRTLVQQLRKLMDEYGYYQESLRSYSFSGTTEAQRAREFIAQLRREPLREIAGEKVVIVRDYGTRIEYDLVAGAQRPIDLPEEDVLQWVTEQGSRVTLRPSGTEPKMKLYLGVRGRSLADSQERLAALEKAFDQLVQNGLGNK
ncbi:MAG: phospho-sugar mutase [Firmicutes bacterium]|nr:phospho-sugar mutase [Bacillota bacterium]